MRMPFYIVLITLLLTGCQTAGVMNDYNEYVRDYKKVPHGPNKFKALSFAGRNYDMWTANYSYDWGNDIQGMIKQLLDRCTKYKRKHQVISVCKINYLGNSEITYSRQEELSALISQYRKTPHSEDLAYEMIKVKADTLKENSAQAKQNRILLKTD